MSERLPRTAGSVGAIESSCDLIEVKFSFVIPARKDALQIYLVAGEFIRLFGAFDGDVQNLAGRAIRLFSEFVEGAFSIAARLSQAGFAQQPEMRGNARLSKARDLL